MCTLQCVSLLYERHFHILKKEDFTFFVWVILRTMYVHQLSVHLNVLIMCKRITVTCCLCDVLHSVRYTSADYMHVLTDVCATVTLSVVCVLYKYTQRYRVQKHCKSRVSYLPYIFVLTVCCIRLYATIPSRVKSIEKHKPEMLIQTYIYLQVHLLQNTYTDIKLLCPYLWGLLFSYFFYIGKVIFTYGKTSCKILVCADTYFIIIRDQQYYVL